MNSSRTPCSSLQAARPDCGTPARCPKQSLPAVLAHWRSGPARAAPVTHPAKYRPRWPGIPACNRLPPSTCESLFLCSRNHSRNLSTCVHSASPLLDWSPPRSSGSGAVAESSSPSLPRGTTGTPACGWPAFLPAPAAPSAADSQTACAWPPAPSNAFAVPHMSERYACRLYKAGF
jgi:hypothetical protein